MSLLMDALKKAEQEKREAAKRLRESETTLSKTDRRETAPPEQEPPAAESDEPAGSYAVDSESPTMELSLAPLDENRAANRPPPAGEETGEQEQPRLDVEDGADEGKETGGGQGLSLAIDDPVVDADDDMDDEGLSAEKPDASRIEELDREESSADPDETFHSLDLGDSMDRAMFEETVQGDVTVAGERGGSGYDETLPGVSALQMAEDIGSEDQPTPVAAETVFTAGTTTRKGSTGAKWILIGTTVVMIVAAAIWYYYTVTPINRDLPSPSVARGIENITPVEPPPAGRSTQAEVQSGSLGTAATASGAPAAEDSARTPGEDAAAPAVTQAVPVEEEDPGKAAQADPVAEETKVPASGEIVPEQDTAAAPVEEETADNEGTDPVAEAEPPAKTLPQTLEAPPSMIKISRSRAPEQRGLILNEAYRSYKNGDHRAAAEGYEKVLRDYPDNRDALLGLAAVALKRDEIERASRLYMRLLQLNPRDSLARAALINLGAGADGRRSETVIKQMLQDNPDVAFLHFALGNIHASQSRWPDAQQAFFDAYRLDDGNADYAMNLAVSLDRLGKSGTALDYYRTALELAENGEANFDPESLRKRIATLEGRAVP